MHEYMVALATIEALDPYYLSEYTAQVYTTFKIWYEGLE